MGVFCFKKVRVVIARIFFIWAQPSQCLPENLGNSQIYTFHLNITLGSGQALPCIFAAKTIGFQISNNLWQQRMPLRSFAREDV